MKTEKYDLDLQTKRILLEQIKQWFLSEMDMDFGDLKAELVYDFIQQTSGKEFFNLGVKKTKQFMLQRLEDLEIDMDQILV